MLLLRVLHLKRDDIVVARLLLLYTMLVTETLCDCVPVASIYWNRSPYLCLLDVNIRHLQGDGCRMEVLASDFEMPLTSSGGGGVRTGQDEVWTVKPTLDQHSRRRRRGRLASPKRIDAWAVWGRSQEMWSAFGTRDSGQNWGQKVEN
ncbi:hypothetical protein C8R46DRAFT_1029327 [Mycena filopes]|nr:hypothetical protein C8R46DRAFT_1029327 [Mycena filopes]